MALKIEQVEDLKLYLQGVMGRADHHANQVNEIALALIGGILWRCDGELKVKQYADAPANILWMHVGNKKYCFCYNHSTGTIEVKENTYKGPVLKAFSNSSTLNDVRNFFENLYIDKAMDNP